MQTKKKPNKQKPISVQIHTQKEEYTAYNTSGIK